MFLPGLAFDEGIDYVDDGPKRGIVSIAQGVLMIMLATEVNFTLSRGPKSKDDEVK